jgi:chaperonin GroES
MKFRPLRDRVLIQRLDQEETTRGGIIIPDTAKEKPIEGKVVAVGSGRLMDSGKVQRLEIEEGHRILFGKYAGTEIKLQGETYVILRESDVLGIVDK